MEKETAMEILRKLHDSSLFAERTALETIIPELAESEDEKIRKALVRFHKSTIDIDGIKGADIIVWLEKQGNNNQNWKPSKEEMDVLYGLAYITNQYDEHKESVITSLYQDLKQEFFNGSSYENMFPTNTSTEDDVRRRSTIQVLEYARSLDTYNQYGKADIDKNIAWLEKQCSSSVKWQKNTPDNKPAINHSVLMKTTQGIAEGEWQGEHWFQYRWSSNIKDSDVLAWMELSDLNEQGEKKPFDYESANILQKDFASKQGEQKLADNPPISRDEILYQLVQNGTITAFDYLYLTRRWNNTESPKNYQDIDPQQKVSVVDFNAKDWYVSKVDGQIHDMTYNPTDEVEPKFKVGDWISGYYTNYKVTGINSKGYAVEDTDGNKMNILFDNEKFHHLWNIQDAKDGDVLADGNLPFIFKKIDSMMHSYAYCGISVDDGFKIESEGKSGEWTWTQDIKPATKEQRDTLERAMTNAGYRWNKEELKLEKI